MVAYRQPVSRSRVSAVRGVNCDGVMRTLLQRGLVEEAGTEPETGAILYRTTNYFLERMGLRGLDELPGARALPPGGGRRRGGVPGGYPVVRSGLDYGNLMRSSSGRNSGDRNYRGAGNQRDDKSKRAGRPPRPEERRYDVGATGGAGGTGSAKGAPARGGQAKGGPAKGAAAKGRPRKSAPARPRELDAQIEERNRARHDKPQLKLPKTFPGAEQEGERLQKVLARAGMGSRRACEELIEQGRVEVNGADRHRAGHAGRPGARRDQGRRPDRRHPVVPVLRAQQAGRRRLHHGGPGRPPVPRRLRHQPRDPALPRRPARHRDRGHHPAHQPRRAGPPSDPPASTA